MNIAILGMGVIFACVMCMASGVPTPLKCTFSAKGVDYDLSALYQTATGSDYKAKDAEYTYSFNVCGSSTNMDCKGIGCQYNEGGQLISSLASATATPAGVWSLLDATTPNAGVRISYSNGDQCWAGTPRERRVDFEFYCSPNVTTPTVRERPQCHFTIRMGTPLACGTSVVINSCQHKDVGRDLVWDLSSLRSATDYSITSGDVRYSYQFCDRSTQPGPCSAYNSSACIFAREGAFRQGLGGLRRAPAGIWHLISDSQPEMGIEQQFSNGDACVTRDKRRVLATTIVRVYCQHDGKPEKFDVIADLDNCMWYYVFATPQGCPTKLVKW